MSPALVVYYFGSKEKLLTEALAHADDRFYLDAFHQLTGIGSASERLVRLIDLACPPVETSEMYRYWTLWVELWSRALRNTEAARKREALDRRWRNTIADVVRGGQRTGEFGACDPDRFATYLAALMDGLTLQVLLRDSEVDSELLREVCLDAAARKLGFELEEVEQRSREAHAGKHTGLTAER